MGYVAGWQEGGGAPVNFVYHASSLGAKGYAISAVGNDSLGRKILQVVNSVGVNLLIEEVNHPTGTVQVKLKLKAGIPSYIITEGVAWDHIPFTHREREIALKMNAVCFGTLAQRSATSKGSIRKFIAAVPDESYKVLDLNLRHPFYTNQIIKESIQLCNVLKMNVEELDILKGIFQISLDERDACHWLMDSYQLEYLILTAGEKYSITFSHEEVSYLETPKVEVVDTVGAGDSFTAAFVTTLLEGESLAGAHEKAVETAAAVCQVAGAWF